MAWKSCTSCRKDIAFSSVYWKCSVSTCNHKRLGLFFCTVACWDAHLPEARHREAWAVEERSPSEEAWKRHEADEPTAKAPVRRAVAGNAAAMSSSSDSDLPVDVLVVVSKMKKYIKAKGDMKTSETAIPVLSRELRRICDKAIRIAGQDGRKTVMDRDVRNALKD